MSDATFYRVAKQQANEYPVVEGTRCVSVKIPNDPSFLPVLAAMLAGLGNTWASVGTPDERRAWAKMWQDAYAENDWDGCMDCAEVADCIENDSDVQQAINNVYNSYQTGVPMPASLRGTNIAGVVVDCEKDALWGAISELIDNANQRNIDVLEANEVLSEGAERLALVIGGIPIFETLPIDEFIDYVQNVWSDGIYTVYVGNDTDGYRDELKCDLFCLALDNDCVLTLDMLYLYFSERVTYVGLDEFAALVNFFTTGVWIGTQLNDIFYLLQWGVLRFGNQFFNVVGLRPIETDMALGRNNPDPDWEILCIDCFALCRETFDFVNQPPDLTVGLGTLDAGGFILSADLSGTAYVAYSCDYTPAGNIRRIRLVFSDQLEKACQIFLSSGTFALNGVPINGGGGRYYLTHEIDPSEAVDFLGALARQLIGDGTGFLLIETTVVYDC